MFIKLFIITLYAILWSTLNISYGQEMTTNGVKHAAVAKQTRMRCTRRFSPGVCVDEVTPVWTFVFLAQNCTERLGCPNSYRTNRFRSYRMCMKRCRPLVDMYLQMVEFDDKNSDAEKKDNIGNKNGNTEKNETIEDQICAESTDSEENNGANDKNLRQGLAKYSENATSDQETLDQNYEDLEDEEYRSERESQAVVYKDIIVNKDIMTPDVDYIAGEFRSKMDFIHY